MPLGSFFLELTQLILKEWATFQNIFECEKDKASVMLLEINQYRSADAHAKIIDPDDFVQLRLHFNKMEAILEHWGF